MVIYLAGMHGIGDNIHQRAVVKYYAERHDTVYLETSWPQLYWDISNVKFLAKGTKLRTQLKNQNRDPSRYIEATEIPTHIERINCGYGPGGIRAEGGSVLHGMMRQARVPREFDDYSFQVKPEWVYEAKSLVRDITKPILLYRPLVVRKEWESACLARNPDIDAYAELFEEVRHGYHVISIADLSPNIEWAVSRVIPADTYFHMGQLSIEVIAGFMALSHMTYCAPGFMTVLARSMRKPVITVFGGYENSKSFHVGKGPYLGIDTIKPCDCFQHEHACVKEIDIQTASEKIRSFVNENRNYY